MSSTVADAETGQATVTPAPYCVVRSRPDDAQKTVVICGAPRGGTTFGASVVANLGVPFKGGEEEGAGVGRRYSHRGLMPLWREDPERFKAVCRDIDRQREVWAFKLAGVAANFDRALEVFRNPHFIVVLKEPLSVAMRSHLIRGRGLDNGVVSAATKKVLRHYAGAINACLTTEAPAMLISYDLGMRNKERVFEGVADFLGIAGSGLEPAAAATAIDSDRDLYFEASLASSLRKSSSWRKRWLGKQLGRIDKSGADTRRPG
jgi:hypothetical protein